MALSIAEYARKHGIAEVGIRRKCKSGALPAAMVKGRWMIEEAPSQPQGAPGLADTETLKRLKLEAEVERLRNQNDRARAEMRREVVAEVVAGFPDIDAIYVKVGLTEQQRGAIREAFDKWAAGRREAWGE